MRGFGCAILLAIGFVLCASSSGFAQALSTEVGVLAGAGVERGGTKVHSVVQRAPIFLDASLRHWSDEESRFLLGGSLRVELEGSGAIAAEPRAELRFPFGKFELRPGIAASFFFAPRTMFGPQMSLALCKKLGEGVALFGMADISAYFIGSDVPRRSTVVVGDFGLGVTMGF